MIDPTKITNFKSTKEELEEALLFWVAVAGKSAIPTAKRLDQLLRDVSALPFAPLKPFDDLRREGTSPVIMAELLKKYGFGCYQSKGKTFYDLMQRNLDLKTCTVDDLMAIHGIGPKTARCFLIHTRPNARYAGLDTHILRYLRDQGHNAPMSTPTGKKYLLWEKVFLDLVPADKPVAELDLEIWRLYSGNDD